MDLFNTRTIYYSAEWFCRARLYLAELFHNATFYLDEVFRHATFYLAELFCHATYYLAEQFCHATFYLAEQFRHATFYLVELFRQIAFCILNLNWPSATLRLLKYGFFSWLSFSNLMRLIFERAAIAERSYKRPSHTVIHKCSTKTRHALWAIHRTCF